ncbi:M48 family metallopeptidase [Streptomyces akebiae]|uniref:M48 family metalloprotease n=1 Tax=Streptomyces akebiae TaxID=2865673 RepID=A0ABX8XKS1_9ACTN|nr:M48 family metallopeptidase [Streptomyces akebiae]QYX76516.1 M48 family metalloprotease [Streptomyces akebiae]
MTRRVRIATASVLLLGFYVLVAGGALLWLLLFGAALWLTVFTSQPFPAQVFVVCAGTAPLAVALADAAYRTIFLTTDTPEDEVLADVGQAPQLYGLVQEVAAELGTEPPSIIRFTTNANAAVIETDTRFIGLGEGNRCLVIGLPLLAVLTQDQLRAVLAHELAHFSLGHSRARAFTLRLDTSLRLAEDSLDRMGDANGLVRQYRGLPRLFVAGYRRFARMLTAATRRRQEEEADREAVRLYGVDLLADALRARGDVELAWPAFRKTFLDRKREPVGRRPDDPFRVFAMMAASPEMRPAFERLRAQVVSDPRHSPCDAPHADFAARIRAARTAGPRTGRTAAIAARAGDLLPDMLYENDLVRLLPECEVAQLMPWQDWVAVLAERRAVRLVGALMRAVDDVAGGGPDALSLRRVIAVLDSGERMPLAWALGSRLPRNRRRNDDPLAVLVTAVTALVSALLVSGCGASWRFDWTGGVIAEPADGTPPEDVAAWVEEAVFQPDRTAWLTFRLAELGLDDRTPACRLSAPSATDGGAAADFVLGEVDTELPEKTSSLVFVLRSAALSVIVGSVLLGLAVSWGQGREWLRHDTTRSDTFDSGGGTGHVPSATTSGPFPSWSPTPLMPVPGAEAPPSLPLSTPLDVGPLTVP